MNPRGFICEVWHNSKTGEWEYYAFQWEGEYGDREAIEMLAKGSGNDEADAWKQCDLAWNEIKYRA